MVEWSIFNEIFAVAFNVLYIVIIIGTIFIVILDNRNPGLYSISFSAEAHVRRN